ncbi:MAG: AAA family ATPase [Clostridia bacterium]|nr:AAA family ATPase [Clostridia bacterium]
MKNVIHIFGASGAGTTMLGRKISKELGFFFMDTDDYFWMPTEIPYTVKRPVDDRLALMIRDIEANENVVLSGSLTEWGDPLTKYFTLAIRVNTETSVRIERLKKREYAHFADRIKAGGDMYEAHQAFLAWAARYDEGGMEMRSRVHHDLWQEKLNCRVLEVDGANELDDIFRMVKPAIEFGGEA